MKKLLLLIGALLVLGLASCSTDFWDGFVDGYNSTRYRSYEKELPPDYQPYEYRLRPHN
jgi:gamma-glutamyl:cysteine ligase YbdK (ATP-grasp superfamily)